MTMITSMAPKNETMDEARERIKAQIQTALDATGIWQGTTCPAGEGYGWYAKAHYALEQIQRNPPTDWHVSRSYKFECYDWVVVKR